MVHIYSPDTKKVLCFLYSLNANFDSNVLVEHMIKILGKDARFIVKCPYLFMFLKWMYMWSIESSCKAIADSATEKRLVEVTWVRVLLSVYSGLFVWFVVGLKSLRVNVGGASKHCDCGYFESFIWMYIVYDSIVISNLYILEWLRLLKNYVKLAQ